MVEAISFDLTNYNSYRIKSRCAKAFFPETDLDLEQLYCHNGADKKIIIGGGYNIILSKEFYNEHFVIFSDSFSKIHFEDTIVTAQAGASLYTLSKMACDRSLSGFEIFYDIPSSLGGAVVMNAGASGEEIKDLLISVRYFDPEKKAFFEVFKEDMDFSYRNSFFQKNPHLIITEAALQLKRGNKDDIYEKMQQTKAARWSKQPKQYPNAGSVFKRPPGRFVGPMIDELGLKGYAIGGARVSEKHSGFIINYDNATGKDIVDLISFVKEKVLQKFGIALEIEQRII